MGFFLTSYDTHMAFNGYGVLTQALHMHLEIQGLLTIPEAMGHAMVFGKQQALLLRPRPHPQVMQASIGLFTSNK